MTLIQHLNIVTLIQCSFSDDDQIIEWLVSSGQLRQVWQCVQDGERYVRATALEAMTCLMHCKGGWQAFISIRDEVNLDIHVPYIFIDFCYLGCSSCNIISNHTSLFRRRS